MLGGHGSEMQRIFDNNRNLLAKRKHLKELYSKLPHENHHDLIEGRKMTPLEFEAFKRKLQDEKRIIELKLGIILLILVSIGAAVLYSLFYFV